MENKNIPLNKEKKMTDKKTKWKAVIENDKSFDGVFFYAVKSTGIFCRPSCQSKPPLQSNAEFFDTPGEATVAGYRPCKRCRPDLADYKPVVEIAEKVKKTIDTYFKEKNTLSEELSKIGVTQHRMTEIFLERFNVTPGKYADGLRIDAAKEKLSNGKESILDIALHLGFDSVSAFYSFFRKHTQMAPREYRQFNVLTQTLMDQVYYTYETMFGKMVIVSDGSAINAVYVDDKTGSGVNEAGGRKKAANAVTNQAAKQLEEYFSGKRQQFDLPLRPVGTAFQQSVWKELIAIPYGDIRTYKQVAQMVGNPDASRAVGMANNKNPIVIIIPCHRVVGSNGSLVGYAYGLEMKQKLLDLEKKFKAV